MEKLFSIVFFLIGITLFTCKKQSSTVEVTYAQTQCEDPWGREASSEATVTKLTSYLAEKGLTMSDVRLVKEKEGMMCMACNCATGQVFYGLVAKDDLEKAKELGFSLK